MKPLSQTVARIPASGIRKYFDLVSEMEGAISLGVGEPDFVTPGAIRAAAIESLNAGKTAYTSNFGLIELREAISENVYKRYGVRYAPKGEILVTVGVSEALDVALRALLDPGDEVLVVEPCFVSYKPCVAFAGGVPIAVPTRAETNFAVDLGDLKRLCTERTKAVLLSFPTNPTGAVMDRAGLQAVMDFCIEKDLWVLTDEIYDRLSYDRPHVCVPSLKGAYERTIYLNGFSKAYAMTGWRIGYACAPAPVIELMMKVHQYTMMSAPTVGQWAALEGMLSCDGEVAGMVADYDRRRKLFVAGLNSLGIDCNMPGGAFYAFPSVKKFGLTDVEFAERLLTEQKVLVVPGSNFGAGGEGHVRCCYATATEKLEEALTRIDTFLRGL
jgi:aminotransferase